jgi:hypothetical protein
MSETNGGNDLTFSERLRALEASHIRLMTDHEVFLTEQERAWERNQRSWDEHADWLRKYDARCEKDRQDRVALFERIDNLVNGIGASMRRESGTP